MEEICQSIILGIVQGLTEFLPISSSAHLNVFPWIFNWNDLSEGMDVALHLGTLLALAIFFFKDWINLIKAGYKKAVKKRRFYRWKNILVFSSCNNTCRNNKYCFKKSI